MIEAKNTETAKFIESLGTWKVSFDGQHVFKIVNGKIVEVLNAGEYAKKIMES